MTLGHNDGLFLLQADRLSISQAETRAEFAERSVAKLEKTIDDLEGKTTFLAKY